MKYGYFCILDGNLILEDVNKLVDFIKEIERLGWGEIKYYNYNYLIFYNYKIF